MSRTILVTASSFVASVIACAPGGNPPAPPQSPATPEARRVALSYAPTCGNRCDGSPCMAGTEVQALERHDGKLFAGLSSWKETQACIWPAVSAQVLYLEADAGTWKPTPPIPDAQKACKPG